MSTDRNSLLALATQLLDNPTDHSAIGVLADAMSESDQGPIREALAMLFARLAEQRKIVVEACRPWLISQDRMAPSQQPSTPADVPYTVPTPTGPNQILTTDGTGELHWVDSTQTSAPNADAARREQRSANRER